jgi:hypothetical protein
MVAMDSRNARNWRDVAVGCAGRLAACAGLIREKLADPLARECVVACGHAIVDLGAVVDRIVTLFPELKLTESEWESVELARAGRSAIAPGDNPRTRLLLDIGAVEDRVLMIQSVAPEVASDLEKAIKSLGAFAKLIDEKVPGPGDS